jgi:hypothetical protein
VVASGEFNSSLLAVHAGTMLLFSALFIIYTMVLYRNGRTGGNSKMTWLLGFIVVGFIAMPIYWWKYIWQR